MVSQLPEKVEVRSQVAEQQQSAVVMGQPMAPRITIREVGLIRETIFLRPRPN